MSTYTPNYNFPMYEGTDAPNLLDDYNSFAQLADAQIKAVADANTNTQTAVSNLTTTVEGFDSRITAAQSTADGATTTAGNASAAATAASSAVEEMQSTVTSQGQSLTALTTQVNSKAPTTHASAGNTYGLGTASLYGHLRLSDSMNAGQTVDSATAATPAALQSMYNSLGEWEQVYNDSISLASQGPIVAGSAEVTIWANAAAKIAIVDVAFSGLSTSGAGAIEVGLSQNLPDDYRPTDEIIPVNWVYGLTSGVACGNVILKAAGNVNIRLYSPETFGVWGSTFTGAFTFGIS